MKLSMNWLRDFVDLGETDAKAYCDRMTDTGSKVEGWEVLGEEIENVVVGRIVSVAPHENSDHLQICQLDVGTGATVQDIASRIIKRGELGTLDGMHIVKIPDSWMPENVLYMIVAKNCCVAPKKIETLRVIENHPDIDGHVVQGRILHDCFVLEKKAGGILVAKSSAT